MYSDIKRWWWNVRFAWHLCRATGFNDDKMPFAWLTAVSSDDSYDDDETPYDAAYEELSHWYD